MYTRGSVCVCMQVCVCVCVWPGLGGQVCVRAGVCAQLCRNLTLRPLSQLQADPACLGAPTFLASAVCPSLPGGGSVDAVKSLGSSQSRIFASFIRESSFLLAMFSTRFRLVEACKRRTASPLASVPSLRAAAGTASGLGQGQHHFTLSPRELQLTPGAGPRLAPTSRCCAPRHVICPGASDSAEQALSPGPSDSNTCLLQVHDAAAGPSGPLTGHPAATLGSESRSAAQDLGTHHQPPCASRRWMGWGQTPAWS